MCAARHAYGRATVLSVNSNFLLEALRFEPMSSNSYCLSNDETVDDAVNDLVWGTPVKIITRELFSLEFGTRWRKEQKRWHIARNIKGRSG